MPSLTFSDFEKEINSLGIKNPVIKIELQSVKIISLPFFNDVLAMLFIWTLSVFLMLSGSMLFFGLVFFGFSLYFFYFQFLGMGVIEIDFSKKKLVFKNRIWLLNLLRRMFGTATSVDFSDIKAIDYKEGLLLNRFSSGNYSTRYLLLLETNKDAGIALTQFRKQGEADKMSKLLKKFLLPS